MALCSSAARLDAAGEAVDAQALAVVLGLLLRALRHQRHASLVCDLHGCGRIISSDALHHLQQRPDHVLPPVVGVVVQHDLVVGGLLPFACFLGVLPGSVVGLSRTPEPPPRAVHTRRERLAGWMLRGAAIAPARLGTRQLGLTGATGRAAWLALTEGANFMREAVLIGATVHA
eukprot:CAMPEP_0202356170 /NCGR_PEP_ID=MMETSP1126-20121109/10754_1 /ASSEMBLY_ACC=CAM_ASM_000457 /TAXON_ID=3047 /ORGANISM="Dunaliella tertiolecta, Strain CCMP1320" /LENGTH=173 /DNA_ID=CAMNT_0048948897 /DNA_START=823 /DNA_END=1345 /DNA_ORIENTATION=+